MLQMRMSESDPRLYNVNRDVAHNFRQVMEKVAGRLEDKAWPELAAILDREGIDLDDLGDACEALCKFVSPGTPEELKESMPTRLIRCGWSTVKPGAQVAIMAILGTVILGYHFAGVREATLGGEGPALSLQGLAKIGEETARYIALPPWRRKVSRAWQRVRGAWAALRGTT